MNTNTTPTFSKSEILSFVKNEKLTIYKAHSYRWEDTADPEISDETYHLTSEEAIEVADKIQLDVDYQANVDRYEIELDVLNDTIEDDDSLELSELCDYKRFYCDSETVYTGNYNDGKSIENAIIIQWSFEKYVGYAHNFMGVRYGKYKENESSIKSLYDNTRETFESVLLTADEVEGLEGAELLEKIMEEIRTGTWKWNHFKNQPSEEKVIYNLGIKINSEY